MEMTSLFKRAAVTFQNYRKVRRNKKKWYLQLGAENIVLYSECFSGFPPLTKLCTAMQGEYFPELSSLLVNIDLLRPRSMV